MRVLHIITRLIIGGAQENTIATVLGLYQTPGWSVRLIAGPTRGPEGSLESQVVSIPGLFERESFLVRPVHPLWDLLAWIRLGQRIRRFRPHLVHTHSGKAGILGRLAARVAQVPLIVHSIHGPSFGPFQGKLANTLFRTAEQIAGRWTTHFVTVADAMRDHYLAAGIGRPEQYTTIYSGFALEPYFQPQDRLAIRHRLGLEPEAFVVAKIARLFRLKGHEELLTAAPQLVRRIPQIRFLLIGDGILRPQLEAKVKRLGLEAHFRFVGLVPPEQIPELLAASDVVVHLSHREGLPRALAQGLAAGRPVVAWDCDGAREVCIDGKTGFLLRLGDVDGLCERIERLARDPELRSRFAQAGRALVQERFDVHRMIERILALYRRLAKEHGLPLPESNSVQRLEEKEKKCL